MDTLAPGHGWADLGAQWSPAGWRGTAEVGLKQKWGDLFGTGWVSQDAGGVGVGVRW